MSMGERQAKHRAARGVAAGQGGEAFTLVELLVVMAIIVLLLAILLANLAVAREAARRAQCAANQRGIGQSMAMYATEFGVYPPAYVFNCPYVMINQHLKHWSDLLANRCPYPERTTPLPSWSRQQPANKMFCCPSFERGGLPPANTPAANLEPGQTGEGSTQFWDRQARRTAYAVNEAICPRPYMPGLICDSQADHPGEIPVATRTYRFVRPGDVRNGSRTILLAEWTRDWRLLAGTDPCNSGNNQMCMSYQTVHGFAAASGVGGTGMLTMPQTGGGCMLATVNGSDGNDRYDAAFAKIGSTPGLRHVRAEEVMKRPAGPAGGVARLNWLGRNHQGKTNFAYVDGHVESKTIEETLRPFEWGERFFSLMPGDDVAP